MKLSRSSSHLFKKPGGIRSAFLGKRSWAELVEKEFVAELECDWEMLAAGKTHCCVGLFAKRWACDVCDEPNWGWACTFSVLQADDVSRSRIVPVIGILVRSMLLSAV